MAVVELIGASLDITGDAFHPEWNYTINSGH
jgi:hypothetical protein